MERRSGDTVKISGDYQYKALTNGNPVQRFWHYNKQLSIKRYMLPDSTDNVVDVGCGSGVITSFLARFCATILGIDCNPEAIEFAKKNISMTNIKFRVEMIDENFLIDKLVDKIYCLEVIEHIFINQAREMLKGFYSILKPGGKIFLTTPNYKSMWPLIEWMMDRLKLYPPLLEQQHVEYYDKKKLYNLFVGSGFEVESISTTCFISPWLAPFSWTLAEKVDSLESKLPFDLGSILVFVLVKRQNHG